MIYLDNAATSFPKPACMLNSVLECISEYCGNPGRSGHNYSIRTGMEIFTTRKEIAELIGINAPSRIIFTFNTTDALNLAIKGVLNPGDHVITTSMEHNSVLRPLKALEKQLIETTIVKCNSFGLLNIKDIENSIKGNTRMIICTHSSNVTGTLMPVEKLAIIAKKHNLIFLLDAAQSAGCINIDAAKLGCDLIAAPGHKGLLGPQGTGFLYVKEGLGLKPVKEGGTGTDSKMLEQPLEFPDRYEAGTLNSPGITGLGASVKWIRQIGIENIRKHEENLIELLDDGLRNMKKIIIYGPADSSMKTGITAFNIDGMDSEEVAYRLSEDFGIAVRAGFHCAGLAHRTIGTWDKGAVRISVGPFNERKHMIKALDAIYGLSKE